MNGNPQISSGPAVEQEQENYQTKHCISGFGGTGYGALYKNVVSEFGIGFHGFRNRTSHKRAYGGGIADCSKTAPLFSMRSRQSSGMAAPEGLDQVPSSIIGGASS